MNTYSIYCTRTGLFTGATIICAAQHLAANVPAGHSCMLGRYDHLSQRIDVETGRVIDYQPPRPSERHEWDPATKRWVYRPTPLEACHAARRNQYPLLQDFLDAYYWQQRGNDAPMRTYLARCDAVKEQHPKPVGGN